MGTAWQVALSCVVIFGLLLIYWKENSINAYFAKRWSFPNTDFADTAFYPDHFLVKIAAAESRWQYDKVLALTKTDSYLVFVMGKNHALAFEKAAC